MNKFEDYEDDTKKKFKLTRGMLILIIALVVLIIGIIIGLKIYNSKHVKYASSDFTKLEERMEEESKLFVSQNNITLTEEEIKINLSSLLSENGGGIDKTKVIAAQICTGYTTAVKTDVVTYKAYISCGKYYTTKGYVKPGSKTTNKDTIKPVITLNGDANMSVAYGSTYTDKGAKATDNVDGDITSKIKRTGSVDTTKAGTYRIIYKVSDHAGNIASKIRTVIVNKETTTTKVETTTSERQTTNTQRVETTSERRTTTRTFTTTKATTQNVATPTISLSGSTVITLYVGNSYHEPGYYATDGNGNNITSSVSVSSNLNTNAAGTYYITYTVRNSNGKTASKTRTIIVKTNNIALTGISLSPNSFTLSRGQSRTLTVYYTPSNASNKSLIWTSSNNSVATVSGGSVHAVSAGTAVITARSSANGSVQASSKVTVK